MEEADSRVVTSRKRKEKIENSETSPEKKLKSFCCRTFRQELKKSEALKSLKRFIVASKNSDDVVYEYLESGGSLQEILSLIDTTATGDLTTALPVFEVVHLILLRFQSPDSKFHLQCVENARKILHSYLFIIKAMLTMNVTKQKKAALRVLTAITTLDSSFANEIMNVVALSPTLIADLIQPSPEKESVRKCFILFVLSFLVEGNLVVVKNLLDKKGFLSSIIPDLKFDEATTVNLALSLFEDKILKNIKIPKTLKLRMFNTNIIKSLFDLYDWKGLQGVRQIFSRKKNKIKEVEVNKDEKEIVIESVHSFLLLLCCSQKYGVAFYDKSLGTSEQLKNQLLLTVFEGIPDLLKNKKMAEVVLKTIASCPDLIKPVLVKLEPSFQPRNSKNWFQAVDFVENLIITIDAPNLIKNEIEPLISDQIIKAGKALCAPIGVLRAAKLGSQKSQEMEIRLRSLRLLCIIWNEILRLFSTFKNFEEDLKKSLYKYIFKFLPDAEDLVELWHTVCDVEFFASLPFSPEKKILFLTSVIESLQIIVECRSDAVSSPLSLASNLLHHVELIKDSVSEQKFLEIQVKIVQFVEKDLPALIFNMDLFKKSLLILLRSTDNSSLSYLSKIMANLEIFVKNKSEVDVWLLCYMSVPREHRSSVAGFLIESFRLFFNRKAGNDENTNISKMDFMESNGISADETVNDSHETIEESLTPLIFNCIEILKFHSVKSSKEDQKILFFRQYLNDVIIHLQYFYTVDVYLYDHFKGYSKVLGKSILNFLKSWKSHSPKALESDVSLCPLEFDLVSWFASDDASRSLEEIIDVENTNLLKLYSLFRIVIAYLIHQIINGDLLNNSVKKFIKALSLLVFQTPEDDRENVELISYDLKNKAVYQRHCLNCLFQNKYLLKEFDAFQKKENVPFYTSKIIFEVMMEKEIIKSLTIKKKLSEPWKHKFLKQLKAKLKKKKSIDGLDNLGKIFNFFEYNPLDVAEMIELLLSVSELDLFVNENFSSAWVIILSKFTKMYCQKEELNERNVKKLCLIMKHLSKSCCSNVENMNDCFVYLLRKHPSHLLVIDNELLDVIFLSTNVTSSTFTLGKLLLNDPRKVKYFLQFIINNFETIKDFQVVFSLLSTLIINEDSFLNIIKMDSERSFWKISEINRSTTPDLFRALEVVYKKFEKSILQVLDGDQEEIILKNISLTRELVKLFFDKKQMTKLRKEISKGKFEPELLFEVIKKFKMNDLIESYLQGLLLLFCQFIRKLQEVEKEEIVWSKYCSIIYDVIQINKESSWQTIVGSSEWKEFTKLTIGFCLSSTTHSSLLKILRLLIAAFYKPVEGFKDCGLFFQMVISHSQFLKVMLSDSPLKAELVELFYCLIERSPSEMSPKHFPILLSSYNSSLFSCDRTILEIMRFYEKSGIKISDYEPFVWGETAVSHYSIGTSPGLSLWQRFNMGNVMDLLDIQRLEFSLKEFPIYRDLKEDRNTHCDPNVYDPAFLLPLFVNLLSSGSVVFCLSFIYKGGLAYTVRALSSECKDIRLIAAVVLARFHNHLELSLNLKQKLVWLHFINCFRYGIKNLSVQPLPNITTLFFARMTLELSRQPAEMYLPLQKFLLAKSYFSFDTVPEFLPLFHSSEVSYWKNREWLLEVIRDGTKTALDINIIFHTMALKVVFCFFHSQLCDIVTKKLILQVIERMLRIDKSTLLISEYGLLNWITSINSNSIPVIFCDLLKLLSTLIETVAKGIQINKSKHSNLIALVQILNMVIKLLPSVKQLKSVEAFKSYLKIVGKCFVLFTKEGKSNWFKLNKSRLMDIIDAGIIILGENYDYSKYCKVPFFCRDFDEKSEFEDLKNSIFLFNILVNK